VKKKSVCITPSGFEALLEGLKKQGYQLVGPTRQNEAIVYDTLETVNDLPSGWTEEQEAGTYRLKRRDDEAFFGYTVGPHSWKKFLFPSRQRLWQGRKTDDSSFETLIDEEPAPRYAFIGVRACDLHAIQVQDQVFTGGSYQDPVYAANREDNFIVAVNCGQAAKTCFCTSMNTGPKVDDGYDIALTEIINGKNHYFVAEAGTERGNELLDQIPARPAAPEDELAAQACTEKAKAEIERSINTADIKELLYRNYDNPHWEELQQRCLSCGNCTMVCPTCFCSKVEDTTDLTGRHAERWRSWDSCFTLDFSYVHGGSVRSSVKSRYRRWLTHKLATWIEQFGSSGCVGCGRCITWCPVGIDITEEVAAIRNSDKVNTDG
jgi:ferredoxin